MKVSELKERKQELGYTNEMIAELSGVPLGTVQKIFGGITQVPRYGTLKKIEAILFPELKANEKISVYEDLIRSSSLEEPVQVGEGAALDFYDMHDDDFGEIEKIKRDEYFEFGNESYFGKKQGEYTVDDWRALPEGIRAELIDGVLYNMAAPTTIHQFVGMELFGEIRNTLNKKNNGKKGGKCLPFASPIGVRLNMDDKNMVQPDVMIVCDKKKYEKGGDVEGAPDFIAEVLSPSTANYDRFVKLNKYWASGVREYWIIDTKNKNIWVYFFEKGLPPTKYTFEDRIPIGISGGEIIVDFSSISSRLKEYFNL